MANTDLRADSAHANPTFDELLTAQEMAYRDLEELPDDASNAEMDFYANAHAAALERLLLAPVETHAQLEAKLSLAHTSEAWHREGADSVVNAMLADIAQLGGKPRELALKFTPQK